MKKSDIAKIINRLTDLEVKIARKILHVPEMDKPIEFEHFNELTKITSDLDKIWKGK